MSLSYLKKEKKIIFAYVANVFWFKRVLIYEYRLWSAD